ncbi:hypothetical protein TWF173_004605 [Orbilia oligospora]|nr:hypothetical protein TWF173_004605 [Orbilia oligospora]
MTCEVQSDISTSYTHIQISSWAPSGLKVLGNPPSKLEEIYVTNNRPAQSAIEIGKLPLNIRYEIYHPVPSDEAGPRNVQICGDGGGDKGNAEVTGVTEVTGVWCRGPACSIAKVRAGPASGGL